MERKAVKNKAEEERYIKEEKDKMALEMYEHWLVSRITCGISNLWHQRSCLFVYVAITTSMY